MDPLHTIIILALAIILAYVLVKVLKTAKNIIANIVLGFIVIIVSSLIGLTPMSLLTNWVTIILCALGGIFGAILTIILHLLQVI